jgi:hypothetical protein
MECSPCRPSRRILISVLGIVAALAVGIAFHFTSRPAALASPPSTVRPWAEEHFLKLTKPVRSPGKPTDPQYQARHGGWSPTTYSATSSKVGVVIELPSTEFVPDYEVIEFDAADGFTRNSRSGAVRWLAAKPYDLPPDPDDWKPSLRLSLFHPDGRPMSDAEASVARLNKRELEAWGWQINGEFGSAMKGFIDLLGFENLQWKFQDVFDAATHVSVRQNASIQPANGGLIFGTSLAVAHDAPLIAVIDLAHSETRDFSIPVAKGATVSDADFRIEIIDAFEGTVSSAGHEPVRSGKAIEVGYGEDKSASRAQTFSVIYQINPPSMTTAVSVDAIDAAGNVIKNQGRFMEDVLPVSRFAAPIATATALRVRYRSHQTRLLLKMKSLPGVTAPNLAPADLFDVRLPQVTIRDSFQMRRFITAGSQLKDITDSWSYDTPAAFPMTLTDVSPRKMAQRYLALDGGRRIKIDPAAMTIEFEPPKNKTLLGKISEWFKRMVPGP